MCALTPRPAAPFTDARLSQSPALRGLTFLGKLSASRQRSAEGKQRVGPCTVGRAVRGLIGTQLAEAAWAIGIQSA